MAKAKETKTPVAPTEGTTPAAPAAEKGVNDKFVRLFGKDGKGAPPVNEKGESARIAPQLQAIANTLEACGKDGATRKQLVEMLSVPGVLTTRQPVGRILSYYQKDLQKLGLATVTKA